MTPTKKRKTQPTAKERVLARYPEAYAYQWAGPTWTVYASANVSHPFLTGMDLGDGKTAALAWADAAKRLRERTRG